MIINFPLITLLLPTSVSPFPKHNTSLLQLPIPTSYKARPSLTALSKSFTTAAAQPPSERYSRLHRLLPDLSISTILFRSKHTATQPHRVDAIPDIEIPYSPICAELVLASSAHCSLSRTPHPLRVALLAAPHHD